MAEYKDPLIGAVIEGYQILSLLGEGGIGRVYRAKHTVIGKQIAIKALKQEFARNRTSMARLLQEAKAVNEIHHENVVDIFHLHYNPDAGEAYILMELLEGRTLWSAISQGGALLLPQLGHIGLQICSALSAAHAQQILHRDLKPENIFLTQRAGQKNFVKIIDFGLAKLKEKNQQQLTQDGVLLGTPAYMAPEQMKGQDCDARTDIYALGLILYEMATGAPAHPASHMAELYERRINHKAPDPREKSSWLPRDFVAVLLKSLERQPAQRYASMRELAVELAQSCELDVSNYLTHAEPANVNTAAHDLFYETERFEPIESPLQETQPVSFVDSNEAFQDARSTDEDAHTQIDESALTQPTTKLKPVTAEEPTIKKKL